MKTSKNLAGRPFAAASLSTEPEPAKLSPEARWAQRVARSDDAKASVVCAAFELAKRPAFVYASEMAAAFVGVPREDRRQPDLKLPPELWREIFIAGWQHEPPSSHTPRLDELMCAGMPGSHLAETRERRNHFEQLVNHAQLRPSSAQLAHAGNALADISKNGSTTDAAVRGLARLFDSYLTQSGSNWRSYRLQKYIRAPGFSLSDDANRRALKLLALKKQADSLTRLLSMPAIARVHGIVAPEPAAPLVRLYRSMELPYAQLDVPLLAAAHLAEGFAEMAPHLPSPALMPLRREWRAAQTALMYSQSALGAAEAASDEPGRAVASRAYVAA